MEVKTYNVSLTKMTNDVLTGSGLTRDMVLADLIARGFLKDIRTPTLHGLKHGIVMMTGQPDRPGAKPPTWPTYTPAVQRYYIEHVDDVRKKNGLPPMEQEAPVDEFTRGALAWIASIRDEKPSKLQSKQKAKQDESAKSADCYPKKECQGERKRILQKERYGTIIETYHAIGMPDDFVIVDTETTGLSNNDEIIELSVVSKMGDILYHSYFMPTKEINPSAAAVNHITKAKLISVHAPRFVDEWVKIKNAVGGRPILGHNIAFDARITKATLSRYGIDPREGDELFRGMFDSQEIAKHYISTNSYKLCNLAHLVGITREEQHDSSDDCRMTVEFLSRLDRILSGMEQVGNDYRSILREEFDTWNYRFEKGAKN